MATSLTYNVDCLEYMRSIPDKHFDLLVADPPYGGGFTETGGCKGWFAKYHQDAEETQNRELGAHYVGRGRQKRYAEVYDDSSQSVQVERERERATAHDITASEIREASLNGTSATQKAETHRIKTAKKLLRGTLPQDKNTSTRCFASHAIRSFGAAITFSFRRHDAF